MAQMGDSAARTGTAASRSARSSPRPREPPVTTAERPASVVGVMRGDMECLPFPEPLFRGLYVPPHSHQTGRQTFSPQEASRAHKTAGLDRTPTVSSPTDTEWSVQPVRAPKASRPTFYLPPGGSDTGSGVTSIATLWRPSPARPSRETFSGRSLNGPSEIGQ
jgi:hypothetical protein